VSRRPKRLRKPPSSLRELAMSFSFYEKPVRGPDIS
jgi:hypothetical protein